MSSFSEYLEKNLGKFSEAEWKIVESKLGKYSFYKTLRWIGLGIIVISLFIRELFGVTAYIVMGLSGLMMGYAIRKTKKIEKEIEEIIDKK